VPESSIVIEYLDTHYPGATRFIPADKSAALEVRLRDRFFDLHVQAPMQAFNANILRPADKKDSFGAEQSREKLKLAKQMVEDLMATRTWAAGEFFSMADCAATPALYYANIIVPLGPHGQRYLERLSARPSIARVLREAEPFFQYVPREAVA
jgi:glutathione S-transferase